MSGLLVEPRKPAHAGSFYPAEPGALARLVERQLAHAAAAMRPAARTGRLLAVLVPHAALHYSGAVAARGWLRVGEAQPPTIVLLGTDHRGWTDGVAVWDDGPWIGPFGSVPVDDALAGHLLAAGDPFTRDPAAHLDEHSLEVQMPYVATACPGARIVACSVGLRSPGSALATGQLLAAMLRSANGSLRDAVLVASSDFAHYPTAEVARSVGRLMLEPLLSLDAAGVWEADERARRLPGVVCGMCGIAPASVLVAAMRELGAAAELLGEGTSADVPPHDADRCVGYAAVAFTA